MAEKGKGNIDNLIANGGGLLGLPVPSQEILP